MPPTGTGPSSSAIDGESKNASTEHGEKPELPVSAASVIDTDGDGLPDQWEIENFGNLDQNALTDSDGDGESNAQEYAQNSDPQAASPVVEDLKNRPIVPGTVGGTLAVSASGAAVYTVPIALPPGVNGHAPSLSLNYSSQAGVGPLGMGWTLSGLSSISRCPRSRVFNGEHHPVDYSDKDLLCLDGQQLLPTDNNYQDYWVTGKTYHPAMNPDTRVILLGNGNGLNSTLTVEEASGRVSVYGFRINRSLSDGRWVADEPPYYEPAEQRTVSWNLSTTTDVSGNSVQYSYKQTKALSNNYVVDNIKYGTREAFLIEVIFDYSDSVSTRKIRVANEWIFQDKVIASIHVNSLEGNASKEVLIYGMEYGVNEIPSSGAFVNHLKKIYKCEPKTCVAPEEFVWNEPRSYSPVTEEVSNESGANGGWDPSLRDSRLVADFNNDGKDDVLEVGNSHAQVRYTSDVSKMSKVVDSYTGDLMHGGRDGASLVSGDFDGDGLTDVLSVSRYRFRSGLSIVPHLGLVSYGTGDVAVPFERGKHIWTPENNLDYKGWRYNHYDRHYTGDFNGDGKTDLLIHAAHEDRNNYGVIFFSTGDRDDPFIKSGVAFRPDSESYLGVVINHQTVFHVADFDGDGISDILAEDHKGGYKFGSVFFGTGKLDYPLEMKRLWSPPSSSPSYLGRELDSSDNVVAGDFNGDGKSDFILYQDGSDTVMFYGTGYRRSPFVTKTIVSSGQTIDGLSPDRDDLVVSADVDGNGLSDLIIIGRHVAIEKSKNVSICSNLSLSILLGTGDGASPFLQKSIDALPTGAVGHVSSCAAKNRARVVPLDSNGDGALDFISILENGTSAALTSWEKPQDVIKAFGDTASTGKSMIDYAATADADVYQIVSPTSQHYAPPEGAYSEQPSARKVVSRMGVWNGKGDYRYTRYKYFNGAIDPSGLGSLGFARRVAVDEASQVNSLDIYFQGFPLTGMQSYSRVFCCSAEPKQSHTGYVLSSASTSRYSNWAKRTGSAISKDQGYYSDGAFFTKLEHQNVSSYDPVGDDAGSNLRTTRVVTEYGYADGADQNGQALNIEAVTTDMLNESNEWTVTTVNQPEPDDLAAWRVGRISATTVTHSLKGKPDATVVRSSAFKYNGRGQVRQETIEPDRVNSEEWLQTDYSYDAYGYKNSVSTTGVVDSEGNLQTRVSTAVTHFDAGSGERVVTASNALGQSSTSYYSVVHGGLLRAQGINGLESSSTYDGFGRVTSVFAPDGSWTTTTRALCGFRCDVAANDAHAVTTRTGSDGARSSVYTDVLGREVASSSTALGGEVISAYTQYNARGFVAAKSVPIKGTGAASAWQTTQYDTFGRVVTQTPPDSARMPVVSYSYSGRTRTKRLSDRAVVGSYSDVNGEAHTQSHSAAVTGVSVITVESARGKLALSIDSASNDNSYDYDAIDSLVGTTDAEGRGTALIHDVRGRKIAMQSPEMGYWSYRYNSFGELVEQTDAKGQLVAMSYDVLGRLQQRSEAEGSTHWTWDIAEGAGKGKLASVTSPGGVARAHVYDLKGRPLQTTVSVEAASYSTAYGYDALGRNDRIAFPDSGVSIRNVYDEAGYLYRVEDGRDDSLLWQAEAINAHGQLTDQQFGNTLHTRSGFDAVTAQLDWTETRTLDENGQHNPALSHHERYAYDGWGNLAVREDVAAGVTELFAFDEINRLTHSTIDGALTQAMEYSATGDIESKISATHAAAHVGAYTYDAATGRLDTVAGEVQRFDANGNLEAGRGRTSAWTSFNKPRHIQQGEDEQYFVYNAERQRVLQIVGSKRTVMLDAALGGMAAFSVESDSDTGHKRYQHTVLAGGKPVASIIVNQEKSQPLRAENTNYLHVDRMGSVVMVTDEAGQQQSKAVFDAWGLRRSVVHGAVTDPFAVELRHSATDRGFTQHQMLDDVGLIHMNARLYDPVLGRMLSADPLVTSAASTQGFSRYAYVENNPFRYTDPSGYSKESRYRILKTIVIIGVSIYTGGLASGAVAGSMGFANAAAAITGSGATAWSAFAVGAAAGAAGAFTTTALSGGSLKESLKSAAIGGLTGGLFAGSSYGFAQQAWWNPAHNNFDHRSWVALTERQRVAKVLVDSSISGLGAELSDGKLSDGARTGLYLHGLGQIAQYMRHHQIMSSMRNPYNSGGTSGGAYGDNFKLGGGRFDASNGLSQVESPLGGLQGGRGVILSRPYSPGSLQDHVVEMFAGPHDYFNAPHFYDQFGNIATATGSGYWNAFNLLPAAPLAIAGELSVNAPYYSYMKGKL